MGVLSQLPPGREVSHLHLQPYYLHIAVELKYLEFALPGHGQQGLFIHLFFNYYYFFNHYIYVHLAQHKNWKQGETGSLTLAKGNCTD